MLKCGFSLCVLECFVFGECATHNALSLLGGFEFYHVLSFGVVRFALSIIIASELT